MSTMKKVHIEKKEEQSPVEASRQESTYKKCLREE